ncbi:VOC family protein [Streptomyces sp. SPB074]|uniref:VOC family protein n=1 Tax=Streptomyces sp. (strain SPB074) TaxID=465543 RepID=UPI00017F1EFC|nr:VOC family protein [Streptomyces sp. SPB074]EDY45584.1 glyoxalase [Streptomyces sp. SPB074]
MIASLQTQVLNCPEPRALALFYARLLGGEVDRPDPRWALGEDFATLHLPGGAVLSFQRDPGFRAPTWPAPGVPVQSHLDLGVRDLDAAERVAVAAGARRLPTAAGIVGWRVYADPAGHVFCLVREHG